jgi:SAM-dependent methyltransferase
MANCAELHAPHLALLRSALLAASPRGARVALDLGCGAGAKTPWLAACAAPGALVLGLDRDLAALRAAPPSAWLAGDAHALPLRDDACDLIWCVAVLGLLAEPAAALAELRRVLRPGGTLVLAVAGERWVRLRERRAPVGDSLLVPADGLGDELREPLARAGLTCAAVRAFLLDPPGLEPHLAALPLADGGDAAAPGDPEPRAVLLIAAATKNRDI